MKLMVLEKPEEWKRHCCELNEAVVKTIGAVAIGNKEQITEEVVDTIQVCIGMLHKLYKDNVDLQEAVQLHNQRLLYKGWKPKADIRIQVSRK